jgi:hypothetical protein
VATLRRKAAKQAAEELPAWLLSYDDWCEMVDEYDDPDNFTVANFYRWLAARRDWCDDHGILDEWAPNPDGQPQLRPGGAGLVGA